jgi:hypothetical protein
MFLFRTEAAAAIVQFGPTTMSKGWSPPRDDSMNVVGVVPDFRVDRVDEGWPWAAPEAAVTQHAVRMAPAQLRIDRRFDRRPIHMTSRSLSEPVRLVVFPDASGGMLVSMTTFTMT